FFDDATARVPDKVAIIDLWGGRGRFSTYRQLDARMDAVARMVARLGVRPGERVAMLVGNRTEFVEFFFGSMRAGAIPLPLTFQPYTSGSTGRPKGAIMTHRGMLWYVAYNQRYWPSAESDRGMVALPLFHKNALRGTVKPMLYAGGSFVLMPGYQPRAYLDALA